MAHRHAEFARARAEALATARGEALMHVQQALREAEKQQMQLADALKRALLQLGVEVTPNKPLLSPTGILGLDASLSQVPIALLQQHHERQQQQQHEMPAAELQARSQQEPTGQVGEQRGGGSRNSNQSAPARGGVRESQQLSGFTVYSNELLAPEFQQPTGPARQASAQRESQAATETEEEEERESSVAWRDISAAASVGAAASVDESGTLRRSVSSVPAGDSTAVGTAAAGTSWQGREAPAAHQGTERRQQHAARLARLVLPHLDASQLDSLVRIGASLQSPDEMPPLSPADLQQMLPGVVWESGVRPEELLHHLQREAAAAGGALVGGGAQLRRPSQQAHGRSTPSELVLSEPYFPEVPGAGTWVSPTLSAQVAAKKARAVVDLGGMPEPSPPTHIKAVRQAVFKGDMEFYNALGGEWMGLL